MEGKKPDQQQTEQMILDTIQALRENPERYRALQEALSQADSDEEKVRQLVRVATTDRELAALIPRRGGAEQTELAWTTVTVTTIFIPSSAY